MRPDEFNIDNCLKCSTCNTVCPVHAVLPEYPGPKRLGPELERLRQEGIETDSPWVEYCLGCHRCDLACPNQVNVSHLIACAKGSHRKTPVRFVRDWWFARPGLLGKLMCIAPRLSNTVLRLKPMRWMMSRLMRITARRIFPAYTSPTLRAGGGKDGKRQKLLFFPGCYIRYNNPELGRKAIALLERNGYAVEVAGSECCGLPAQANGDTAAAHALARANVQRLAPRVSQGARIVTACPSCGHMLKTAFAESLNEDKKRASFAQLVAANTYDISELLEQRADENRLDVAFKQTNLHLAYHAPCHQRSQGIGRPWLGLLRSIPGVAIEDLDAGCCGMSGTYGFKEEKYGISMAVGQGLFERIQASNPRMVVTECATCQMQIEHGARVTTAHPIEIMLAAYAAQASTQE